MRIEFRKGLGICILAAVVGSAGLSPATAEMTETERLKQCDRDLCAIVLNPKAAGKALKCDLSKTWYKDEIVKAIAKSRLSWPFGDAQCAIKLEMDHTLLSDARTDSKYTLKMPAHTVACEVDSKGTRYPLAVTLAPQVVFKDGKATAVSLNVAKIDANTVIHSVVWTASKMESSFGMFQSDFLKGINDYITQYCPKTYGKRS